MIVFITEIVSYLILYVIRLHELLTRITIRISDCNDDLNNTAKHFSTVFLQQENTLSCVERFLFTYKSVYNIFRKEVMVCDR